MTANKRPSDGFRADLNGTPRLTMPYVAKSEVTRTAHRPADIEVGRRKRQ